MFNEINNSEFILEEILIGLSKNENINLLTPVGDGKQFIVSVNTPDDKSEYRIQVSKEIC